MKDDLDEEMNVENWAYNGTKTASGAVLSQGGTEKSETISFSFLILWSSQTRVTIAIFLQDGNGREWWHSYFSCHVNLTITHCLCLEHCQPYLC